MCGDHGGESSHGDQEARFCVTLQCGYRHAGSLEQKTASPLLVMLDDTERLESVIDICNLRSHLLPKHFRHNLTVRPAYPL